MKLRILTFLILLTTALTMKGADATDDALTRLDESLSHKTEYENKKRGEIDQLRQRLQLAETDSTRYNLCAELHRQYSSYQYDSAYVYADRCIALADKSGNSDLMVESRCFRVFCLLSAGLYKEAFDEYEAIDPSHASSHYKYIYYSTGARLCYDAGDYNHALPYQRRYIDRGGQMTDSLMQYLGADDPLRDYHEGLRLMKEYKGEESEPIMIRFLKRNQTDPHLNAIIASCLGWLSMERDENKAIEYLTQAAIIDNETVTKETTALCLIGTLLYKWGDTERAIRYVQMALDDANFYDARHRLIQVGQILPIIEHDRYEMLRSQRNLLIIAGIISLLFVLALAAGIVFFRRQNRKLAEARQQLEDSNALLSEANHIKDEYIGKSFYFNSEYIKHVEKLYKTVERKIVARQYDDLRNMLRESTIDSERENMFSAFDETFLSLFPDFIERFNALFPEKDRKQPATATSLTPEMRIFALIRLGVTDSERIANFLNYSVHTINTYKTRVKNKSDVPNDEFENYIMKI